MAQGSPDYFDLQVNGYGGVDFNADDLTDQFLRDACQKLRDDGVQCILATIITDEIGRMSRRLRTLIKLREADALIASVIAGIHIEGPFINESSGYVGTHPPDAVCPADLDMAKQLIDAAGGLTRMFTLAPERDPGFIITRWLAEQGVAVSAGHCDPSLDVLDAAIDAGLSLFTHLGNGCPLQLHRHDNIVQRVLSRADRLQICFIGDGIHVSYEALGNYLKCAGAERCIIVSDAISAAGLGPGAYQLAGQHVMVDEQGATWSADQSHLMGSATPLPRMARRLRNALGLDEQTLHRLTCINPRKAIGLV